MFVFVLALLLFSSASSAAGGGILLVGSDRDRQNIIEALNDAGIWHCVEPDGKTAAIKSGCGDNTGVRQLLREMLQQPTWLRIRVCKPPCTLRDDTGAEQHLSALPGTPGVTGTFGGELTVWIISPELDQGYLPINLCSLGKPRHVSAFHVILHELAHAWAAKLGYADLDSDALAVQVENLAEWQHAICFGYVPNLRLRHS